MNLTRYEQETIINFNEAETTASVYTHNSTLRRRLEQLAKDRPEDCRLVKRCHDGQAVEYTVPKRWLKVNPPRSTAPLTEEQKQKRREQLERARNGQNRA